MSDFGRYSPLHEAHRRAHQQAQARKEAHATALEITDRKAERRNRDQAVPQGTKEATLVGEEAATRQAQPDRPAEARPRTLVPDSPAPGESEGHFAWRRLATQRIERVQEGAAMLEADRIPRIMRTEANSISRSTELRAAFDRLEAEQAQRAAKGEKAKDAPEKDIEPEI